MSQKRNLTASGFGLLQIIATLITIAPSPVLASNPYFTPTGSQLDTTDPILDIVPGSSIRFNLFLDTTSLVNQVRINQEAGTEFRYDTITGIDLIANFDPSELGNPRFSNSGLFPSGTGDIKGGAIVISLSGGLVSTSAGAINLGSATFSTYNLISDGSTDFSLTASTVTQVDFSQLGVEDNQHTFSAMEAGMGPSQIIEVQPVPAPLPFLGVVAGFSCCRVLRKRIRNSKAGALIIGESSLTH